MNEQFPIQSVTNNLQQHSWLENYNYFFHIKKSNISLRLSKKKKKKKKKKDLQVIHN